jgi:acyl-CoA thioesterase
MPYEFDTDTAVVAAAPGLYRGRLTDRWNIGMVPNGGYVLAFAMAALKQALPRPDPITVTAHYLGPAAPGEAEVEVQTLKVGRQFLTATASLRQNGREAVRLLATYGDLSQYTGPTYIDVEPPAVPPLDHAPHERIAPFPAEFRHRFEQCFAEVDSAAPRAEMRGWIRFADRRPMDVHCLGLIADAFPPAVFNVTERGWVPTLELTVHVRARPRSDTLLCVFRTHFLFGGLLQEDGEIWDESGTLVAQSRQLAAGPRAAR